MRIYRVFINYSTLEERSQTSGVKTKQVLQAELSKLKAQRKYLMNKKAAEDKKAKEDGT